MAEPPPPFFPLAPPALLALTPPRASPESFEKIVAGPGLLGLLTGGVFSSNPTFTQAALKDIAELDKRRAALVDALKAARLARPGPDPPPDADWEGAIGAMLRVLKAADAYIPMLNTFVDIVCTEPRLVTRTPNFSWSAVLAAPRHLQLSLSEGIGFVTPELAVSSFRGELYQTCTAYACALVDLARLLVARCPPSPPSPATSQPASPVPNAPTIPPPLLAPSLAAATTNLLRASSLLLHLSQNVLPAWPDPPPTRPPELHPGGALALSNAALAQAQHLAAVRTLLTRPNTSRKLLAKLFVKAADWHRAALAALRELPAAAAAEMDRAYEMYFSDAGVLPRGWAEGVLAAELFDTEGRAGSAVALLRDAKTSLDALAGHPAHPLSRGAAQLLSYLDPLLEKAEDANATVVFEPVETDPDVVRGWIGEGRELAERKAWEGWEGELGFGRGRGVVLPGGAGKRKGGKEDGGKKEGVPGAF